MNDSVEGRTQRPRYTMVIQWSEEDRCYQVSLPEWQTRAYTAPHGSTYEEAAKNGREVLELLLEQDLDHATPAPEPKLYRYPGADVVQVEQDAEDRQDMNAAAARNG